MTWGIVHSAAVSKTENNHHVHKKNIHNTQKTDLIVSYSLYIDVFM